ncbi:MAG TPA: hypothetical protein VGC89_04290 [Pyrinomonadaceae bacterium]
MLKKHLSLALVVLLSNVLLAVPARARAQSNNQGQSVEKIKTKVAKIGVGSKARATVRLKNGTKIKGYIAEARSDDFVIRDRQTNDPRTVAYDEVAKVEKNGGHSRARNITIGVAIGVGVTLAILAAIIVHSLD